MLAFIVQLVVLVELLLSSAEQERRGWPTMPTEIILEHK